MAVTTILIMPKLEKWCANSKNGVVSSFVTTPEPSRTQQWLKEIRFKKGTPPQPNTISNFKVFEKHEQVSEVAEVSTAGLRMFTSINNQLQSDC